MRSMMPSRYASDPGIARSQNPYGRCERDASCCTQAMKGASSTTAGRIVGGIPVACHARRRVGRALRPLPRVRGLRQRAETVRPDVEPGVDRVEVLLERVHPGDLDDLVLVEVAPQRRERHVVDVVMTRDALDVGERGALAGAEDRVGAM